MAGLLAAARHRRALAQQRSDTAANITIGVRLSLLFPGLIGGIAVLLFAVVFIVSWLVSSYHTTDAADAIPSGGFRDGTGSIVAPGEGVFLSEQPLMDAHEGAAGDQLLQLEFGDNVDLDIYELQYVGAPRQWFMPAEVINEAVANEHATVTLLTNAERDAAVSDRGSGLAALTQEEDTE